MLPENILNSLQGRNAVVTGGTGLIGREIVRLLCDAGVNVRCVSLDNFSVHKDAEHIKGDLCDFSFCKSITSNMDYVLHVAGIKGSVEVTKNNPASFLVPLLMMNTNMLEAARINNVERVVYTSSIGAYSSAEIFKEEEHDDSVPPMDMFPGWAKRIAEMQVRAYHMQYGIDNFAIVRPCNVYGPGDNFDPDNAMVIPSLMARIAAKEDPVLIWGDGSAIRDFAYSTDVAEGVILALLKGTRGDFVNLGSGTGNTIRELAETLNSFIDFNYEFDTSKPSGFPRRVMDIARAQEWLGYEHTTTLHTGLKATWEWFLGNRKEYLKRKNYFTNS